MGQFKPIWEKTHSLVVYIDLQALSVINHTIIEPIKSAKRAIYQGKYIDLVIISFHLWHN